MEDRELRESFVKVDAVVEFESGGTVELKRVGPFVSDAINQPQSVSDWGFLHGAIVAVMVATKSRTEVIGTACMIAPGLAVTAHHIFSDLLPDIGNGDVALACVGIGTECAEFWNVTSLSYGSAQEIAYLSLARASDMGAKPTIHLFRVTMRRPMVGEPVTFIGFRMPTTTRSGVLDVEFEIRGDLYLSAGTVKAVYPNGRDSVLMPFPTIEVDCASLGGMSGGALVDQNGCLLGVTSTGMETPDGLGPSNAAWIVGGLHHQFTMTWPKGLYRPQLSLLDLDKRLLFIEGRDGSEETGYRDAQLDGY